MKRFILFFLKVGSVPACWVLLSLGTQRLIYNPIGNPEAKHQLAQIKDSSIVFLGPSTFHRRIDCEWLSSKLNREVFTVTSDGQSLIESSILAKRIRADYPSTQLVFAGQNMQIDGTGLHQCWSCSNLDLPFILGHYSDIASCFWFDAFNGLMARMIPPKPSLPFINEHVHIEGDWIIAHERFGANQDSIMASFQMKLQQQRTLPESALYVELGILELGQMLVPLDGDFYACPPHFEHCIDFSDSSWLRADFWQDEGHLSAQGIVEFNSRILREFH